MGVAAPALGGPGTGESFCQARLRNPGWVLNRKAPGLGPCAGKALQVERRACAEALKFGAFLEPRKAQCDWRDMRGRWQKWARASPPGLRALEATRRSLGFIM